jgi:hypothetical protein
MQDVKESIQLGRNTDRTETQLNTFDPRSIKFDHTDPFKSVVLQIVKIYESCQPVGAWDRRELERKMCFILKASVLLYIR